MLAEAGFDVGVLRPHSAASAEADEIIFDTEDDNDLQSVLDNTQAAFDDALGEAATLEVQGAPEEEIPNFASVYSRPKRSSTSSVWR